jgi:Concanavalin A-like lectin/glucanases superfamily/Protein kinase domain
MAEPGHTHPNARDSHPPDVSFLDIRDHELIQPIGKGGSGEVWLAKSVLGTYRAVKIVYEKTFRNKRPFEREFNGVKRFEPLSRLHEGLMDVLQVGRADAAGYFYCVLELADDVCSGTTIDPRNYSPRTLAREASSSRRVPTMECLQVGAALAAGLGFLHRHGLIHRDIKPSNIVFVGGVPKLADVGLVAELADARSYVGTDGFIPPEGPGTIQADIYSLGKVLYEISTGKDRRDYPELPTQLDETAHERELVELNKIILKSCRSDPRDRFRSAHEMLDALVTVQAGGRVRFTPKRWKAATMVAAASTVCVLALTLFNHPQKSTMDKPVFGAIGVPPVKADGPATVPSGLVGWWPAEDNTIDSVSGAAGWLINGARASAEGKVGHGFDFDGIDDYVRIASRPGLRLSGPMTVESWVCPRTNGSIQAILSKWDAIPKVEQRSYGLGCLQSGRVYFIVSPYGTGEGCMSVSSVSALPRDQWSHVAATYDGHYLRMYLNGMPEGQVVYTNGIFPGTNEVTIGASANYNARNVMTPFAGRIDEASIYDRSLSEMEIRALYDAGEHGKRVPPPAMPQNLPAGLVGWWRGEGNARDHANNHDGVLKNGASFALGKVGQAFSFDGVDDFVLVPRTDDFDVGKALTIDFWMKADPNNLMDVCCQGMVSSDFYVLEVSPGDTWISGINFGVITDNGGPLENLDPKYPKPAVGSTADTNNAAAQVTSGEWHYIAGTYDGAVMQLYVDGKPVGQKTDHNGAIFPIRPDSFLTFGSEDGRSYCPHCVGTRYFKGLLDEIRIFNRALSAEEIESNYQTVVATEKASWQTTSAR